jgi:hypothetical protein
MHNCSIISSLISHNPDPRHCFFPILEPVPTSGAVIGDFPFSEHVHAITVVIHLSYILQFPLASISSRTASLRIRVQLQIGLASYAVPTDGVWTGNWIYTQLLTTPYRSLFHAHKHCCSQPRSSPVF